MSKPFVTITGGAGYVGAVLVPKLLAAGHKVKVLDLFLYGKEVLPSHPNLQCIQGDIRDLDCVRRTTQDSWAVIHLACISNDPSFELDPDLGRSINYDAFEPLLDTCIENGVERFIYASSSSVYGVKSEEQVTEDLPLEPLTDYSRYKALCEDILLRKEAPNFCRLIIRPATVCGYSPRQRLDVVVNILTTHAVEKGAITLFGGDQLRPNIHIEDMADLYVESLQWPSDKIDGKVYNVGDENHSVRELGEIVCREVGGGVQLKTQESNDPRSYHVSSERIQHDLGFTPKHSIAEAVRDLARALRDGRLPKPLEESRYYNIRTMQAAELT